MGTGSAAATAGCRTSARASRSTDGAGIIVNGCMMVVGVHLLLHRPVIEGDPKLRTLEGSGYQHSGFANLNFIYYYIR